MVSCNQSFRLFLCFTLLVAAQLVGPVKDVIAAPSRTASQPASQKLVRADFKLSGSSCVQCIRRVSKAIRAVHGVKKADVSIFNPHWAVVIYDSDKTSFKSIKEALKDEPVRFENVTEKPISKVPPVVIPKTIKQTKTPPDSQSDKK